MRTSDRVLSNVLLGRSPSRAARLRTAPPPLQVVILAAGMGSRLGRALPKPLTELSDGRTHHAAAVRQHPRTPSATTCTVTIVVGYKLEHIIEAFPDGVVRLQRASTTRPTRPRACCAPCRPRGTGGVLWMNGDVVFDPRILDRAADADRTRPVASSPSTPPRSPTKRSSTPTTPRATSRSSPRPSRAGSARPSASTTSRAADKAGADRASSRGRRPGLLRARHRARDREGRPARRADGHLRPLRGRGRLREDLSGPTHSCPARC